MSEYKASDRVAVTGYGAGTIVRPHGEHRVVVQFDDHNGFHGRKPLVVWAYTLRRI